MGCGMEKCVVALGSKNPVKVYAVSRIMRLLCNPQVVAVDVPSGVNAQPCGLAETLLGALNRASQAIASVNNAEYGVGIEAGIFSIDGLVLDLQVAVIVDRSERVSIGFSQAFMVPNEWVDELIKGVELAEIASKTLSRPNIGRRLGLIGYLTQGLITRTMLSESALIMALVPRLNSPLYKLPCLDKLRAKLLEVVKSDVTCPRTYLNAK